MSHHAVFWRRLDGEGHDACRLIPCADGWRLAGTAVFQEPGQPPACLSYEVDCDAQWCTRQGAVRGWVGELEVNCRVHRKPDGGWTFNGQAMPALAGCLDLDLGFTPATNLFQLQRMALAVGQSAEVPVAWLDAGGTTLALLAQRYERRSTATYWYEAPRFGYQALLEFDEAGFARDYPGLWRQVDCP
jgi:hypothetical protein